MARDGEEDSSTGPGPGKDRAAEEAGTRPEGAAAPDASARPDTGNIRGFPPERQQKYPVAGGAVSAVDRRADEEEQASAAHDPLGPAGFVEDRDVVTSSLTTPLPERNAPPTNEPQEREMDLVIEGPDAGPEIDMEEFTDVESDEEPQALPLSEVVSRHRRADDEGQGKYVLEATVASRWLAPLSSTLQVTRTWVRDTALALGSDDPHAAWHSLHAVLATLRDQLPVAEVADLASELPISVRGVYYEGWTGKMRRADSRDRFLAAVRSRLGREVEIEPELAIRAVVRVLGERVSAGEMRHVHNVLPAELKGILEPA